MDHNYNIPLSSFAKLSGRRISTFKWDFTTIFETTPEKWLQQKRLEQEYIHHHHPDDLIHTEQILLKTCLTA